MINNPLWSDRNGRKKSTVVQLGKGINNSIPITEIPENQAYDMMNLSSHKYPILSVRPKRAVLIPAYPDEGYVYCLLHGINYMVAQQGLYVNDGVWFKVASLNITSAKVIEFMDKAILVVGNDAYYFNPRSFSTLNHLEMPNSKFIAAHDNRIYVSNDNTNRVTYSALRKYDDWSTVNDYGYVDFETEDGEKISSVALFGNHIIVGKPHHFWELYGTGPKNVEPVNRSHRVGVLADKSVKEIDNCAYWLSSDGVIKYNGGGIWSIVSNNIKSIMDRISWSSAHIAAAGTDGKRYYLAVPVDNATWNNILLVLDVRKFNNGSSVTQLCEWYVEDGINIVDFAEVDGKLYAINTAGELIKMDDGPGVGVSWYRISKLVIDGSLSSKVTYDKINVLIYLPTGSTCSVFYSTEATNQVWHKIGDITPSDSLQSYGLLISDKIGIDNVPWVSIKFEGVGPCDIYAYEKSVRVDNY